MQTIIATLHVRDSAQAVALAAGCLKAGLPPRLRESTTLLDLFPDRDQDAILEQLMKSRPRVIAFPLYSWNRTRVLELCRTLKNADRGVFLVAGGPEASADSEKVLREGRLDAVIRGEGELAFAKLLTCLHERQPLSGIEGLMTAGPSSGHAVAACPDLARLPSPWLTATLPLEKGCGVLWEVARGCHFNCAFCYDAKGQRGVRPLPFERLRRELELFAAKGVGQVWVLDSTFNAPPGRGQKLLEMLKDCAPQLHYHIEAKADLLDDDTIDLLSGLDCSVQVGLQSSNPAVLKPLNRHLDPRLLQGRLDKLSAAGITFGVDLIYGLPGDSHQGFENSLDFALKRQPNQIDIFPLAVLPGTELHDNRERFGIVGESIPPYLVTANASYPPTEMHRSRLLAAATDIFYNRGRAVGFFLQLCRALTMTPTRFLTVFAEWLTASEKLAPATILDADSWQPDAILAKQLEFARTRLRQAQRSQLTAAAEDLIHYHYCCAETLLAENCIPRKSKPFREMLTTTWQLNPAVRIKPFNYPVEELERYGGESLQTIAAQIRKDPAHAVFLRQDDAMIVETVDRGFATLLIKAQSPEQGSKLVDHLSRSTAKELLGFAVEQGLVRPAI